MGGRLIPEDIEAEYREPDPEPVNLDAKIRPRSPERYYRCGYLVHGGKAMQVYKYAKTVTEAQRRAREAATAARERVRAVGITADVSWWVQPWSVETSEVYAEAQVTML